MEKIVNQIRLFDLEPELILALDNRAKELKISRNTLIKDVLHRYISNSFFSDYESRYQDLLRKCTTVIGANSHAFETLTEIISGGEEDE